MNRSRVFFVSAIVFSSFVFAAKTRRPLSHAQAQIPWPEAPLEIYASRVEKGEWSSAQAALLWVHKNTEKSSHSSRMKTLQNAKASFASQSESFSRQAEYFSHLIEGDWKSYGWPLDSKEWEDIAKTRSWAERFHPPGKLPNKEPLFFLSAKNRSALFRFLLSNRSCWDGALAEDAVQTLSQALEASLQAKTTRELLDIAWQEKVSPGKENSDSQESSCAGSSKESGIEFLRFALEHTWKNVVRPRSANTPKLLAGEIQNWFSSKEKDASAEDRAKVLALVDWLKKERKN